MDLPTLVITASATRLMSHRKERVAQLFCLKLKRGGVARH